MTFDSGKKLEPVMTISSPPLTEQLLILAFSTWGNSCAERWAIYLHKHTRKSSLHMGHYDVCFFCAVKGVCVHECIGLCETYSTPLELMQLAVRPLFRWVVGCEPGTPRGPECFSVQYLSLLSSARCLSSSTSGFQHNQYWKTQREENLREEYH